MPIGVAPDGLPDDGLGNGLRVRGADVLTMRYQRGTGWNFAVDAAAPEPNILLTPIVIGGQQMDDPVNFVTGDRALLLSCGGGQIFQVGAAGNTLTPTGLESSSSYKPAATVGSFDVRVFNFSRDFITVSYYLAYRTDPDNTGRLIPTLYRRQNGSATPDELVQGVERLDSSMASNTGTRTLHYLTADQVTANSTPANCSPPAPGLGITGFNVEPNCLWRSLKTIEVHLLLDTIDNIALTPADMPIAIPARRRHHDARSARRKPADGYRHDGGTDDAPRIHRFGAMRNGNH